MIKINLLNSVTERQGGAVVAVDRRVSSPASRLLLMTVAVALLLAAVVGWDVVSTQMAKTRAEKDLEEQKQIAAELEGVMKEQKELEQKIAAIDGRINAIKRLRDSQRGPSAVLQAMRERISMLPGLYLQTIDQTGDQVTIKGNSPDEAVVTQFGRSLEFSNGLFSNLNIETVRAEVANQNASAPAPPKPGAAAAPAEAAKVEIVNFTIKCAYTPSKAAAAGATTASNQTPANPTAPPQTAKN